MSQEPPRASDDDVRVARTRRDVGLAALKVLTEEGGERLSHARVAAVAGYSRTTLYTHWPARIDLVTLALDSVGHMPHDERTGDARTDLVGELHAFRRGIADAGLDKVLMALAQWGATVEEVAAIRDRVVEDGESIVRSVLADFASGDELEAAVSMLSGVVVCPVLMYGEVPSDVVIDHAVAIVLKAFGVSPAEQN
jgi:AcrR family transcriptional regulator